MENQNQRIQEYYEILSRNALKGETYAIKFRNEPVVYVGIPVLRANLSTENDTTFSLKVVSPKEKQGVYHKSIEDIEFLRAQ